ncbi:hypothetical protein, partial [Xanthomonas sacchari]|uniref:hypothetical protein n=1 Tax=Xanthomonas sacchari TaxID=56458 RepID=UPI001F29EF83
GRRTSMYAALRVFPRAGRCYGREPGKSKAKATATATAKTEATAAAAHVRVIAAPASECAARGVQIVVVGERKEVA